MTISRVSAQAIRQVRFSIRLFRSDVSSILKKWYYPPFISLLTQNAQPFHPRREGIPGSETIFQHTLKDMMVLHCFLENNPDEIKIDEISFPPRSAVNPSGTLRRIVEQSRAVFGLSEITKQPGLIKIFDLFVLYHDIGKRTGNREDHERIGAEKFLAAGGFFSQFLTDREIRMIYLLIKYHGIYGQILTSRDKGLLPPNYDAFIKELKEDGFSSAEKEFIIKALFLFNLVEGLQSDVFSADFYSTDRFEDILSNFQMVTERAILEPTKVQ